MNPVESTVSPKSKKLDVTSNHMREKIVQDSKSFKTSWISLAQALYSVWRDKYYYGWGFEKFEDYIQQEVGLKNQLALKLLKTYVFLEQEEPSYLAKDFTEGREATCVPSYDAVNVLRMAKQKKELTKDDYTNLKKEIFENGKEAAVVRRDLTTMIKQRKEVDPDEERQARNDAAIRRLLNAIRSFKKDMETLKLAPAELVKEADHLLAKLEKVAN